MSEPSSSYANIPHPSTEEEVDSLPSSDAGSTTTGSDSSDYDESDADAEVEAEATLNTELELEIAVVLDVEVRPDAELGSMVDGDDGAEDSD